MYIDVDGNKYKSYEDYVNSPDLDPENVYYKLLAGIRIPQNEYEIKLKAQMDEIHAKGQIIETNLNF
jgi:hypothetical protein